MKEKFLDNLKVEYKGPVIGEIIDGYKTYINDLGGGFLSFVETYIRCLKIAEDNEMIGEAKLKARIKDFSSASTNTEKKMLDDVFGVEVVTPTETEKEILMLFNTLIFLIQNDKKYNKQSGYIAYHSTGDFSPKDNITEETIVDIINNTKTREYRYSKNEPQYEKDKMVNTFPKLVQDISDSKKLKSVVETLSEMIEEIKKANINKNETPIMEFHFLTSAVEQEAIRGTASHANYKKTNQKMIKKYFDEARLFRGINSPWKFVVENGKLQLQNFYDTLIENWPFLKESIVERRKKGLEEIQEMKSSKSDILLASQFPFLRKYVKADNEEYPEKYQAEKWGMLKGIIMRNRINLDEQNQNQLPGDTILEEIEGMWPSTED